MEEEKSEIKEGSGILNFDFDRKKYLYLLTMQEQLVRPEDMLKTLKQLLKHVYNHSQDCGDEKQLTRKSNKKHSDSDMDFNNDKIDFIETFNREERKL
jgi:hypothetical protein